MEENIIEITDLSFENVFYNFNINIPKNKFIFISGPNNCGKTALLRILDQQFFGSGYIHVNQKPIKSYKIDDYAKLLKCVIPEEKAFDCETLEDEVTYYIQNTNNEYYKELIKKLKLNKYKTANQKELNVKIKIKIQLLLALIAQPEIILIDNIGIYYTKKEMSEILEVIKYFQEKNNLTVIMTSSNLEESLYSDYIYVISESQIILEGKPLEVLQKDNILNKIGLNVPFMIDLSVKLRDYDLVKDIELDMDRMVDTLWK